MERPRLGSMRRETTEAMVLNIGRELAEIEQAIRQCRGDLVAEPKLTGTWMAHLLVSSKELLHNLLIDTARRPRSLVAGPEPVCDPPG